MPKISGPEKILIIISFYMLAGPNIFNIGAVDRDNISGGYTQYYQLLVLIVLAKLVFDEFKGGARIEDFFLLQLAPCFFWIFLSVTWSMFPVVSLRRAALLLITTTCLIYVVKKIEINILLKIVFGVSTFVLLCDYISVFIGFGVHSYSDVDGALTGNWKGIHPHKNPAGAFCASFIIYSFWLFVWRRSFAALIINGAAIFFLLKTESKTSIFFGIFSAYGLMLLFLFFKEISIRYLIILTITIIVVLFNIYYFDFIYYLDDEDFTGRGLIWKTIIPILEIDPWFGFGYGGFWGLGEDGVINEYAVGFVAKLNQGHNSYIDLVLTIGFPGLFISVVTFYILPALNVKKINNPLKYLVAAVLFFNILYNFMESALLAPDFSNWFFLLFVYGLSIKNYEEKNI